MELTTIFLIVIGILVLYVIVLQLRLSLMPRQAVVVMSQPAENGVGCGVAGLVALAIIVGIVVAVALG